MSSVSETSGISGVSRISKTTGISWVVTLQFSVPVFRPPFNFGRFGRSWSRSGRIWTWSSSGFVMLFMTYFTITGTWISVSRHFYFQVVFWFSGVSVNLSISQVFSKNCQNRFWSCFENGSERAYLAWNFPVFLQCVVAKNLQNMREKAKIILLFDQNSP